MARTSIRALPSWGTYCDLPTACPYRVDGMCDDPRTNKGNGDAACHRMNNRDVLAMLNASEEAARARWTGDIPLTSGQGTQS